MKSLLNIIGLLCLLLLSGCAIKTERVGLDHKKAAAANAVLGYEYLKQGKKSYSVAMSKLKKALDFDDENSDAHHYIAVLYRLLGDKDLASEHFKEARDLDENDSSIKQSYGIYLCSNKSYDEGLELLSEVLADSLYLQKGQIYETMGLCVQDQGNLKFAEKYFITALKLNKKLPQALLEMAQIEFDRNNIKSASSYFNRYINVAQQTSRSLFLGILISRKKGDKDRAGSDVLKLKLRFPDSEETKLLRKLNIR